MWISNSWNIKVLEQNVWKTPLKAYLDSFKVGGTRNVERDFKIILVKSEM